MAIDINEEVRVWGGFTPAEFWLGAAALILAAVVSVMVGVRAKPLLGALCFFFAGGGFVGFMIYRQGLPKGLLWRRFSQEGRFLFLRIPGVRGTDLYRPGAFTRAERFARAFGEDHAGR